MNLTTPLLPSLVLQGVPEPYQPLAEGLSVVLQEAVELDVVPPPERSPDLQLSSHLLSRGYPEIHRVPRLPITFVGARPFIGDRMTIAQRLVEKGRKKLTRAKETADARTPTEKGKIKDMVGYDPAFGPANRLLFSGIRLFVEDDCVCQAISALDSLVEGLGGEDNPLEMALAEEWLADLWARQGDVTAVSRSYKNAAMYWFLYWSDHGRRIGSEPAEDFLMLKHWFSDMLKANDLVELFNLQFLAEHLRSLARQNNPFVGPAKGEHFIAFIERSRQLEGMAAEAAFLSTMAYLLYAWVSLKVEEDQRRIVDALSDASEMLSWAGDYYYARSKMPEAQDRLGDNARYRASEVLQDNIGKLVVREKYRSHA